MTPQNPSLTNAQINRILKYVAEEYEVSTDRIRTHKVKQGQTSHLVKAIVAYRYFLWRFVDAEMRFITHEVRLPRGQFESQVYRYTQKPMPVSDKRICERIINNDDGLFMIQPWERILFLACPDIIPTREHKQWMRDLAARLDKEMATADRRERVFVISGVKQSLKLGE